MQCSNPSIIPVVSPDGLVTFQFERCGTCYACQNVARGQMVVRMRHEMEDPYNVSKYFITLTYDDKFLPVPFSPDEWNVVSAYYHLQPIAFRRYDYSLLDPYALSKFLLDLGDEFRIGYCNAYRDKHHNCICDEPNHHIRYFATGEYGDISHRAHYHACVMFPRELHFMDVYNLVHKVWPYGCSNIQTISTVGACNYVAKHQVKECVGSEFQQIASPIFARYCIYEGGLGRIMKNDQLMKKRYLDSLKTRDKSKLFYICKQNGNEYKIAIPRFLIKHWHPERFSTEELVLSQKEGFENLQRFVFDNLTDNCYLSPGFKAALAFIDWQLEFIHEDSQYSDCNDVGLQNFTQLSAIRHVLDVVKKPLIAEDEKRRKIYVNRHISAKLEQLAGGSSEKDNIY